MNAEVRRVRVGDPDPTPVLSNAGDYCWAPHRLPGRTAYCSWRAGHDGEHVTTVIRPGAGAVVVAVYPDADPPAGRVWSPRDRMPWVAGPEVMGLSEGAWTDEMARVGAGSGVNRQCSVGWHEECSDPAGEECRCACHGAAHDDVGGGRR